MRLTLGRTLVTIVLYELVVFLLTAIWLMRTAAAVAATRDGDWLDSVPMPAWWKALILVPPLLLVVWWAMQRRGRP